MTLDAGKAAEMLMTVHANGTPFAPFATTFGIANVSDAYAVQRDYVALQMRSRGTGAAGYKIGLTSKRMQEMCGIDSPIAGVVLSDRVHASGTSVSASAYGRMGLEYEIAVRLKRDLVPDGVPSLAEVADAVDAVCAAMQASIPRHETVHDRVRTPANALTIMKHRLHSHFRHDS